MAENESKHLFANDGTDWTTPPSPVSTTEARAADKAQDDEARKGDGMSGTNEVRLEGSILEGSESDNPAGDELDKDTDEK